MKPDNIRILEGKSLLWDDITKYYKRNISSEDCFNMHGVDDEVLRRLVSTKPFFSEYYLIEMHLNNVNTKTINMIKRYDKCEWIFMIFICTNKDDYELLSTICRKCFNGYKISYNYWLGYVKSRLEFPVTINLETTYKSLGGRFELTEMIIDEINKSGGRCTLKSINKLIGKRDNISLDLVWFSILRQDKKSKGAVFKFLETYRYGYDFIHTALINKYKEMLKFYKDFRDGKFNNLRLREYKKETHESGWKLKTYIELFSQISFDEILLIGQIIECSKVNSTASMFNLVGRLYSRDSLDSEVLLNG